MNIIIVDDHGIVREGLKSMFDARQDMEIVGMTQDGYQAIEMVNELSPDIVIMDITMPKMNGVEATRQLHDQNPMTKIIILSVHSEQNLVVEVFKAGAVGYVLKTYLFDELVRAVQAVAADGYYLSPHVANVVVGELLGDGNHGKDRFTYTERHIIQLIAEGKTTKQIARIFHKSPKTIDAKRREITAKIGASGVADLTRYAIKEGITSLE